MSCASRATVNGGAARAPADAAIEFMTSTAPSQVASYLLEASRSPPLGREEEADLARHWRRSRDPHAGELLARAQARYVLAIALKYRRYGLPLGELVAEGNFGVAHALEKFDPERGTRFLTYAVYWIRAAILEYVIKSWSLVGGGSGVLRSRVFFKLRRECMRASNVLGDGEAANELVAERMGVTPEELRGMVQRLETRDASLDESASADSSTRLLDVLRSPDNQEQRFLEQEVRGGAAVVVARAVSELGPRDRYIAEHRILADPADELSLAELARRFGISRERARQLESRIKRKLRKRIPELGNDAVNEWIADTGATYERPGQRAAGRLDLRPQRDSLCHDPQAL